jgi:predicted DNA-binding ribbon-helix-helix protein
MKSGVARRSIFIGRRKTSVSLEGKFWTALREIAAERQLTVSALATSIAHERGELGNLSSALRCFVLERYRTAPVIAGLQARVAEDRLAGTAPP